MPLVVFCFLFFTTFISSAQVYVWTNEQGVRVYGDEPPVDGKKADLPDIQSLKHTQPLEKKADKSKAEASKSGFTGYQSLTITTPEEDHVLPVGSAGSLTVRVNVEPELQTGHSLVLLMDGKPIPAEHLETPTMKNSLEFKLKNIYRGSHLLQALIKYKGKQYISSSKRRFHVRRTTIMKKGG